MKRVVMFLALAAVLVALTGCSEDACEKAEKSGKPSHACFVENREVERELKESEDDLKEAEYGSVEAAEEAEQQEEVEEEVEEVEEVLKERRAEETADALEGR